MIWITIWSNGKERSTSRLWGGARIWIPPVKCDIYLNWTASTTASISGFITWQTKDRISVKFRFRFFSVFQHVQDHVGPVVSYSEMANCKSSILVLWHQGTSFLVAHFCTPKIKPNIYCCGIYIICPKVSLVLLGCKASLVSYPI